jgi:hypothetical protein
MLLRLGEFHNPIGEADKYHVPRIELRRVRILFGQDIHGPFMERFGSDINPWRISMEELLKLDADILCEGHFAIYRTKEAVREYIMGYIRMYAGKVFTLLVLVPCYLDDSSRALVLLFTMGIIVESGNFSKKIR